MPHPDYQRKYLADRQREQFIETRAYYLWEQAGKPEGLTLEFWLKAEREFEEEATRREVDASKQQIEKRRKRPELNGQPQTVAAQQQVEPDAQPVVQQPRSAKPMQ